MRPQATQNSWLLKGTKNCPEWALLLNRKPKKSLKVASKKRRFQMDHTRKSQAKHSLIKADVLQAHSKIMQDCWITQILKSKGSVLNKKVQWTQNRSVRLLSGWQLRKQFPWLQVTLLTKENSNLKCFLFNISTGLQGMT